MPPRRPPRLQGAAPRTRTKPASAHKIRLDGLLSGTRRYAETKVVRAIGALFAVVAVVVLAGLAWLWLFRK
jgi:hypothetical protein